ncbi:MAG: hypothetical protein ABI614_15545 [Planctomycetota bacterium]
MSNIKSTIATNAPAPFWVGVTGYMDLVPEEVEPLKKRLLQLFEFLRHGARGETIDKLVADLVPDENDRRLRRNYRAALSRWNGLGRETPIVVLTNLAPGVDTLVANLVLDQCASDNFYLLCPLPFPADLYCGASTFVRVKDGKPDPGNSKRQQDVLRLLARMGAISPDLVDKATGTEDLPIEIVQALKKDTHGNVFAVRLKADIDCHAASLESKFLADRGDSERRNLRYYAAGEFLTVSAHLLVAVWNGENETSCSGTSSVVKARLSGPCLGLLPTTTDLPLQHGGPVWHLLANRPDKNLVRLERCADTQAAPRPPLRLLHPYAVAGRDCPGACMIGPRQARNIELQTERIRLLARIGESLSNFNSMAVPEKHARDDAFRKALAEPAPSEPNLATRLQNESPQFLQGLRHISDTRCRSSDLTDFYKIRLKRTLARLFWMTLLAAISLHFCSHWHPRHSHESAAKDLKEHDGQSAPTYPDATAHFNPMQIGFGWIALGLATMAVGYFARQRSRKLEPHGHDARAIAEGLRVQYFWNLAGLGKSVSANYMSRHRSELDWIRGVIRATSTPYDRWKQWFQELPPDLQLRAFRVVQNGWVRHQLDYFRRAGHRELHALHRWHTFGGITALAGVLTFLKLVSHESSPTIAHFFEITCSGWTALLLMIVAGSWSSYLGHCAAIGQGASASLFPELTKLLANTSKGACQAWTRKNSSGRVYIPLRAVVWFVEWGRAMPRIALELVNVFVPAHHDSAMTQTTFRRRLFHGTLSFRAHLPLALAVACAGSGLCRLITDQFQTSPTRLTLGIIVGGVLLLVGALSVAWTEKNLHSEWGYQYSTMTGLFEAAGARLDKELTALQDAIEEESVLQSASVGEDDDVAERRRSLKCRQEQSVQRIQALLFELGQEALDENAEWLILHRARPLEPVMAG